uniref:Uncharacterized protein n=1 Tax=Anguilla anguilla TaxID=7936 RepID=A0A0E9VG28_ANGAN
MVAYIFAYLYSPILYLCNCNCTMRP